MNFSFVILIAKRVKWEGVITQHCRLFICLCPIHQMAAQYAAIHLPSTGAISLAM